MYHGEFKEPGGKLVQVDFLVESGKLVQVEVSGDFFLYPEEALDGIVGAVEGSAVLQTTEDRARAITGAIPVDVEWLGSSPLGLATAIERALAAGDQA